MTARTYTDDEWDDLSTTDPEVFHVRQGSPAPDPIADLKSALNVIRRPRVLVRDTGAPTTAYAIQFPGERRAVVVHPDVAARLGVKDGDDLPEVADNRKDAS